MQACVGKDGESEGVSGNCVRDEVPVCGWVLTQVLQAPSNKLPSQVHLLVEDVLKDLLRRLGVEGWRPVHKLVQNDAQRPPVHLGAVAHAHQHLRGQVVRRAQRAAVV